MREYLLPSGEGEAAFTEKRSVFIGRIWPVRTEEEAVAHIKVMREKHWDATHNVYAYIIEGGQTRYSDDGEPQGTAGMPVLNVLKKRELSSVCCVVTRYFGGTLLGAGGLVRAYTQAAGMALDAAGISVMRVWSRLDIACPYNMLERVRLELDAFGGIIDDTEYEADVMIHALLPENQSGAFISRVTDVSAGGIKPIELGSEYRQARVNE